MFFCTSVICGSRETKGKISWRSRLLVAGTATPPPASPSNKKHGERNFAEDMYILIISTSGRSVGRFNKRSARFARTASRESFFLSAQLIPRAPRLSDSPKRDYRTRRAQKAVKNAKGRKGRGRRKEGENKTFRATRNLHPPSVRKKGKVDHARTSRFICRLRSRIKDVLSNFYRRISPTANK